MSATLSSRRSRPGTRSDNIFAGEIFKGKPSSGLAAQVEALAVMPLRASSISHCCLIAV